MQRIILKNEHQITFAFLEIELKERWKMIPGHQPSNLIHMKVSFIYIPTLYPSPPSPHMLTSCLFNNPFIEYISQ